MKLANYGILVREKKKRNKEKYFVTDEGRLARRGRLKEF